MTWKYSFENDNIFKLFYLLQDFKMSKYWYDFARVVENSTDQIQTNMVLLWEN